MANAFRLSAAVLALTLFADTPTRAQTSDPTVPAQPQAPKLDPKACTDRDRMTKGDTVETDGHAPANAEDDDPSEKLARTEGVICPPPGLDPAIPAPAAPGTSNMPVLAPPGSPGGDPNVRPK